MIKHFLICATKDHVIHGVKAGFAQAGHGRKDLMSKPAKGDWIIYYSSRDEFEQGKPLQAFTAIGQVTDTAPYQPGNSSGFRPYRRKVKYNKSEETPIRPMIGN